VFLKTVVVVVVVVVVVIVVNIFQTMFLVYWGI